MGAPICFPGDRRGRARTCVSPSDRNHLTRIHPVVWIERAFDRLHHLEPLAMLRLEVRHLADADAMLTADRPAHRERACDEPGVDLLRLLQLRSVTWRQRKDEMKVAIADVADERREDAGPLHVSPCLEHALREPRDRNAHIRRPWLAARTQRHR